jgi:hypothetical protein
MTNRFSYTLSENEIAILQKAIEVIHSLADKAYPDTSILDDYYANTKLHDMTYNLEYLIKEYGKQ